MKIDSSGKYLFGNEGGELFEQLISTFDELLDDFTEIGTVATQQAVDWTGLGKIASATANTNLATKITASVINLEAIKEILEEMKQ